MASYLSWKADQHSLATDAFQQPWKHRGLLYILPLGEFGAKNYFTARRTANTIQFFVPIKRKFFGSILFQNKS